MKGDVIIKGLLEASLCTWTALSLGCIKVSFPVVILCYSFASIATGARR